MCVLCLVRAIVSGMTNVHEVNEVNVLVCVGELHVDGSAG